MPTYTAYFIQVLPEKGQRLRALSMLDEQTRRDVAGLLAYAKDAARASAPLVATLFDVTGLIIYFSVGSIFLSGVLL